jgi:hypothetical protein
MDPQPIPATVVPEPVYCEDVFLDLAKADSGKVHDQVVLAIELQRKRSVCRHLSESILLIDVVDDCFGRFVIGSPARSTNWPLTVSDSPSWTASLIHAVDRVSERCGHALVPSRWLILGRAPRTRLARDVVPAMPMVFAVAPLTSMSRTKPMTTVTPVVIWPANGECSANT